MELGGNVIGSIAGSLHLEGEGDTIEVNPIVTSGTKIATITVNEGKPDETNYDLYAPEYIPFSGVYNDLTGKPYLNGRVISGNMYSDNYSADEEIVGTWFGETLYQKSYDINFTSSNNGQDNVIDSTFGDDKLIRQCQIIFDGLNQLFTNNTTFNDTLYISNGQLIYYFEKTDSWWNNLNHCIIHIQYTKSTT